MSDPKTVRSQWGMICPNCYRDDSLDIAAVVQVRLCHDGTDADASSDGGHCWSDESGASCSSCHWTGTVMNAKDACILKPERFRDKSSFTLIEVDAALCVWEYLCDDTVPLSLAPFFDGLELGTPAMRQCAIQAGLIADAVFKHMKSEGYGFQSGFDCTFVPAVLNLLDWPALVEDNQFNGPPYRPDPASLFDAIFKAKQQYFYKANKQTLWMEAARRECLKQWAFPELLTENRVLAQDAYEAGENPADFVRKLGDKHGLTPRTW